MSGHWEERVIRTFPYDPYEKTETVWVEDPKPEPSDRFEDAARAEAERYARTPRMNVGTVTDRLAEAYMAGAAATRGHPAEQEASDAEVEAVAVAICLGEGAGDLHSWGPATQARFRETARAALRAAARVRKGQG